MHDASETWTALTVHAAGRRICPRCSGKVDRSVEVCESHDAIEGICDRCGRRFGAMVSATCTNCVFDIRIGVAAYLGTTTEVMGYLMTTVSIR